MSSDLLILVFSAIADIFIAFLVLFRNYKKPSHIAFFLTSISLLLWATLNYVSTYAAGDHTLLATRFTGFFGAMLIASFYALSIVFPKPLEKGLKKRLIALGISTSIIGFLSLTSLFISTAVKADEGLQLSEGPLYPIYPLFILSLFILCNVNFIKHYRKAARFARSQIALMWLGIFTTLGLIILSNVILPAITSSWTSTRFGSLFTVPFIAITAYAIIIQRMFEVRWIITRTFAYTATIGVVAGTYTLIVLLIATQFTTFKDLGAAQFISLLIPTLFIALTFHSIQAYIDRVSTRLFYRNAYDTREVLDRLSDALMSNNSIADIIKLSSKIISSAIKPDSIYFVVFNEHMSVHKTYPARSFPGLPIDDVILKLRRHKSILIEKDTLPGTDDELYEKMNVNNVDIILRLGNRNQPLGALLLGTKSNGGIYTTQDLQLLKISAKNLVVALENAHKYEQILHFADTMHEEVNKATLRLKKANEKLRTLDALKDDFIATASHQLRTPAASVHDTLHMLNHPSLDKKDREELTRLAEASSEHLVMVVRTMLNMARLQAGHFTIDKSAVDLIDLTQTVVDQTKVIADQKNTKIKLTKPKQSLPLRVDAAKINEALSNYIENAIKYSPDGSTIKVTLTQDNKRIIFEVADQGMGVPIEEQKHLFGKFYRATNARQEQPDGNGIGLYVVKSIAEGHGGQAYYRNSEKGGSVFGFWLPND